VLFLALVSCDRTRIYEKYKSIPNATWSTDAPVKFDFEIKDTTQLCNMIVKIRYSENYPYQNLYLFMKTIRPDGVKSIDTLEFYLLNGKGKPLGDCSGSTCSSRYMIDHNFKFPIPGRYEFELKQAMRTDEGTIPMIMDVGLRVEKAPVNL